MYFPINISNFFFVAAGIFSAAVTIAPSSA
jgi:hypothetical protein